MFFKILDFDAERIFIPVAIFGIWCPNELIIEEYPAHNFKRTVYHALSSWSDLVCGIVECDVAFSNIGKLIQIPLTHSKEAILQAFREKLWGNQ